MLQFCFLPLGLSYFKFLILKCFAWKQFAEFSKAALGCSSLCVLSDAGLGLQQGLHSICLVFKRFSIQKLCSILLFFISDLEEAGIKFGTEGKVCFVRMVVVGK